MAVSDLQLALSLTHNKTPKIPFNPGQIQSEQAGTGVFAQTVSVGTTAETLTFADITTPLLVVLWNLDATNFVEIGVDDTGTQKIFGKLRPSASFPAILPWSPGKLLSLKADTATCKVYVCCYEE